MCLYHLDAADRMVGPATAVGTTCFMWTAKSATASTAAPSSTAHRRSGVLPSPGQSASGRLGKGPRSAAARRRMAGRNRARNPGVPAMPRAVRLSIICRDAEQSVTAILRRGGEESRRLFGLSRFERHLQCISDPEHEEFQCLWPHSHQGANGESSFTLTLQWHFSQDCAAHCFHARFQELFNNLIVDFEQKSYCQAREYNLKHQSHQQPRCALGSSKLYNTILKASSCSNLLVVTLFFHRESAA